MYDDWVPRETNATLVGFEHRITEQTARRNVAMSLKTPDLNVTGAVTYLAEPEFHVGWRAGAGLTLPLFTTHAAGVAREEAELARLQAELEATRLSIDGAVAAALARAAAVREQVVRGIRCGVARAGGTDPVLRLPYRLSQRSVFGGLTAERRQGASPPLSGTCE